MGEREEYAESTEMVSQGRIEHAATEWKYTLTQPITALLA
jgi:hypothetical protein